VALWTIYKLALPAVLAVAIIASASARPPRQPIPQADLRWLVLGALALYAVGLVALFQHFPQVAVMLFAAGITTSSLAAWLSRGGDHGGGPPPGDQPRDEQPPPEPDGMPNFDWAAFEREFRAYVRRSRTPAPTR
jgi:hypothetical protein